MEFSKWPMEMASVCFEGKAKWYYKNHKEFEREPYYRKQCIVTKRVNEALHEIDKRSKCCGS